MDFLSIAAIFCTMVGRFIPVLTVLFLWCLAVMGSAAAGEVGVSGWTLLIDGKAFQARGVCYAPTPVGQAGDQPPFGDYFTGAYPAIHARDLPAMRRMGVNCLRIYGWNPEANHQAFLDAAYNNGQRPIYVLLNRWINPDTDWSNENSVNLIIGEWLQLATNAMNHPAVLGYILGNELNWRAENRQDPAFWAAMNRIAGAIRQHDAKHVISTSLADIEAISSISAFGTMMTNFNCWCLQTYRGNSFGTLFRQYKAASGKPLLVTEFGMDAFDQRTGTEYESSAAVQADYVSALWREIDGQAHIVSGGFVFAWADEWWKAGTPLIHNAGGWAGTQFPDGWADEEWWGIHRVNPGLSGNVDSISPREVYENLRLLWTANMSIERALPGEVVVSAQGGRGQTAVLQKRAAANGIWTPVLINTIPFTNSISTATPEAMLYRLELR